MGGERVSLEIYTTVSRHNSEQDKIDDSNWADFGREVMQLAKDYERRTGLAIDVYGAPGE